ncbi:MAG: nicotinate phosphoribosyltransferase [Microbacteriaceae bacterium]|nr:nicotinate phosphoribosyltransferase [Microbacteriaceae bacterium]
MTSALKTDRYELTMLDAAIKSGNADTQVVFEVFARSLPSGRRFGVFAGVGRLIEEIKSFQFTPEQIGFLRSEEIVSEKTLSWLANYSFSGEIEGFHEGEIYFGNSPVLTIIGSFAECVVLETLVLSILNYDSAVASAAARMRIAAGNRKLIEMGSRRANEDAAVAAARASYIAGFDATSNLLAQFRYGIPTLGTSGHAFTLLFDSEKDAFQAQLSAMGENTTFLVDTFDVEKAVNTAVELTRGKLGNVRIDSGDLAETADKVRTQLDRLGATSTKITVTNDLDEDAIAGLAAASVDVYGVGTSLVTGSGAPTASFVFKMVSKFDGHKWSDVSKRSAGKSNLPGRKTAVRQFENGIAKNDAISATDKDLEGRNLQVRYLENHENLHETSLKNARERFRESLQELPPAAKRLSDGEPALEVVIS